METQHVDDLTSEQTDMWGIASAIARFDTVNQRRRSWSDVARELKLLDRFGKGKTKEDEDRSRLARRWFERAERRGMVEIGITATPHGELDLDIAPKLERAVHDANPAAPADFEVVAVTVPPMPDSVDLGISEAELAIKAVSFHGRRTTTRYIRECWNEETGIEIAVGSGRKVGTLVRSIQGLHDEPSLDAIRMAVSAGSNIRLRSLGGNITVASGLNRDGGTFDADSNTTALASTLLTPGGSDRRRRELISRVILVEYPLIARDKDKREIENLKEVFHPDPCLGDIAILGLGLLDQHHHFNEPHWRLDAIRPLIDKITLLSADAGTPIVAHIANRYWTIDPKFLPKTVKDTHIKQAHQHCAELNLHIRAAALHDIAEIPHRIVIAAATDPAPQASDAALASLLAIDMSDRKDKGTILPPTKFITDSKTAIRLTKLITKS